MQVFNHLSKWQLFFVTFLITGIPLWIPFHNLDLNNLFGWISLGLVAALGVVYRLYTSEKSLRIIKILAGGFLFALIIQIIIDEVFRVTEHNLFPFELALGGVAASILALAGIGVGAVLKSSLSNKS